MYLNKILKLSKDDHRLAMIAQSTYYSKGELHLANKFSNITKEKYESYSEFQNSNNKYSEQFRGKTYQKLNSKIYIINLILEKLENIGMTCYRLAKINNVPSNKLYSILNMKDMSAYSLKKLNSFYLSISHKK